MPLLLSDAQERARLLRVTSYEIALDLGPDDFRSTTTCRFTSTEPGATTFIDLTDALSSSATLNGAPTALNDLALAAENVLVVEAVLPYVTTGDGMHRYVDPLDGETYIGAYVGGDNAQRIFACFDQPDLKAELHITVTADPAWTVLSNGRAVSSEDGRWVFEPTPPISTYLMVVWAGPMHSIVREHAGIPFGMHCRRSLAADLDAEADELFTVTTSLFDHYATIFDEPYWLGSYDQAFVPEMNWGALETPGCVTFRDSMVFRSRVTEGQRTDRAVVIAHEMAHMWFGDLMTMRWWEDLWLNEAFAEYLGFQTVSEATRFTDAWTQASMEKAWGYEADQRPSTHPVAPDASVMQDSESAMENADGITYVKGASVLRQLVAWLGTEAFLAGVNDLLTTYRFGNAQLVDFLSCLSRASGQDVHGWSEQWLRTTGVDTLALAEGVLTHPGLRTHRVAIGDTLVTLPAGTCDLPFDGPAPRLLNDGDLTFAKVRYDEETVTWLSTGLRDLPSGVSRAVVWNAYRDQLRDAELAPSDYLAQVGRHLGGETDIAVLTGVLRFARIEVIDRYLDPALREQALADLVAPCQELLDGTADQRLAGMRGLVSCTSDVALLEGHLVDADPNLRSRIQLQLVLLGALEPTPEPVTRGQHRRRAAHPSPSSKDAAWQSLFGGTDQLSTYLVNATVQGFWQPAQRSPLEPYVERWFPAVVDLASARGASVAAALAKAAVPVEPAVLAAGQEALARPDVISALRRELTDQLDDLARALRVRARWS